MPKQARNLSRSFTEEIVKLERTRIAGENLLISGQFDQDSLEKLYSGLFIEVFTNFENLIEKLFFGLLTRQFINSSGTKPLVPKSSSQLVSALLLIGGKNYLDWLPYDRTLERAKIIFPSGEPFTLLSNDQKQKLKEYHLIRNAIAHKSDNAKQKFEREVIGSRTLLPREKTPVGFLRSQFRASPIQIQYENIVQELQSMAHTICS